MATKELHWAPLLALPDDAARALVAFLASEDVARVASVNRFASHRSYFQALRDARSVRITLPIPNGGNDDALRLLQGIHRRNPQRLATGALIEITGLSQVIAILKDPVIVAHVKSVRVHTPDPRIGRLVEEICELLGQFRNLQKLDVSSTPLEDIAAIAGLAQLQELDLSCTNVTDISALKTLTELRVLILQETKVLDINCVASMPMLETLSISQSTSRKPLNRHATSVEIPSLTPLHQLHTLELEGCTVESTADLCSVASTLRRLQLRDVKCRHSTLLDRNAYPLRDAHEAELLERLVQLERIELQEQGVLVPSVSNLAKVPSLRTIDHYVDTNLAPLASLEHLESVKLLLPEGDYADFMHRAPEDFAVLLQLPRLHTVSVVQTTTLPRHWMPDVEAIHDQLVRAHSTALTDVLGQLPNLTSLDYSGLIPNESFLPRTKHLTHLGLHCCDRAPTSFDWIRPFSSLRSLDLTVMSADCDLSAVGDLAALERLRFIDHSNVFATTLTPHQQFLTRLKNLKTLEIGGHVEDYEYLRGMDKLEKLTVRTVYLPNSAPALSSLVRLQVLDVANTRLRDLSSLAGLQCLREVAIPTEADCRPLIAANGPPRLVRVLHPQRNCISRCHHREVLDRRELASRHAVHDSDEKKTDALFGAAVEYY